MPLYIIQESQNRLLQLHIVCLPREPLGCYVSRRTLWKEAGAMVTYDELFSFVIMLCAVITLVLDFRRKK